MDRISIEEFIKKATDWLDWATETFEETIPDYFRNYKEEPGAGRPYLGAEQKTGYINYVVAYPGVSSGREHFAAIRKAIQDMADFTFMHPEIDDVKFDVFPIDTTVKYYDSRGEETAEPQVLRGVRGQGTPLVNPIRNSLKVKDKIMTTLQACYDLEFQSRKNELETWRRDAEGRINALIGTKNANTIDFKSIYKTIDCIEIDDYHSLNFKELQKIYDKCKLSTARIDEGITRMGEIAKIPLPAPYIVGGNSVASQEPAPPQATAPIPAATPGSVLPSATVEASRENVVKYLDWVKGLYEHSVSKYNVDGDPGYKPSDFFQKVLDLRGKFEGVDDISPMRAEIESISYTHEGVISELFSLEKRIILDKAYKWMDRIRKNASKKVDVEAVWTEAIWSGLYDRINHLNISSYDENFASELNAAYDWANTASKECEVRHGVAKADDPIVPGLSQKILRLITTDSGETMGEAVTSLLNQKAKIIDSAVAVYDLKKLLSHDDYKVVVRVNYEEGMEGSNIMLLRYGDIKSIADLMRGGTGEVDSDIELDKNAISEAINQMVASSSASLSNMLKKKIVTGAPEIFFIDRKGYIDGDRSFSSRKSILNRIGFKSNERFVCTFNKLRVGDFIDMEIIQAKPIEFAKNMAAELGAAILQRGAPIPVAPAPAAPIPAAPASAATPGSAPLSAPAEASRENVVEYLDWVKGLPVISKGIPMDAQGAVTGIHPPSAPAEAYRENVVKYLDWVKGLYEHSVSKYNVEGDPGYKPSDFFQKVLDLRGKFEGVDDISPMRAEIESISYTHDGVISELFNLESRIILDKAYKWMDDIRKNASIKVDAEAVWNGLYNQIDDLIISSYDENFADELNTAYDWFNTASRECEVKHGVDPIVELLAERKRLFAESNKWIRDMRARFVGQDDILIEAHKIFDEFCSVVEKIDFNKIDQNTAVRLQAAYEIFVSESTKLEEKHAARYSPTFVTEDYAPTSIVKTEPLTVAQFREDMTSYLDQVTNLYAKNIPNFIASLTGDKGSNFYMKIMQLKEQLEVIGNFEFQSPEINEEKLKSSYNAGIDALYGKYRDVSEDLRVDKNARADDIHNMFGRIDRRLDYASNAIRKIFELEKSELSEKVAAWKVDMDARIVGREIIKQEVQQIRDDFFAVVDKLDVKVIDEDFANQLQAAYKSFEVESKNLEQNHGIDKSAPIASPGILTTEQFIAQVSNWLDEIEIMYEKTIPDYLKNYKDTTGFGRYKDGLSKEVSQMRQQLKDMKNFKFKVREIEYGGLFYLPTIDTETLRYGLGLGRKRPMSGKAIDEMYAEFEKVDDVLDRICGAVDGHLEREIDIRVGEFREFGKKRYKHNNGNRVGVIVGNSVDAAKEALSSDVTRRWGELGKVYDSFVTESTDFDNKIMRPDTGHHKEIKEWQRRDAMYVERIACLDAAIKNVADYYSDSADIEYSLREERFNINCIRSCDEKIMDGGVSEDEQILLQEEMSRFRGEADKLKDSNDAVMTTIFNKEAVVTAIALNAFGQLKRNMNVRAL